LSHHSLTRNATRLFQAPNLGYEDSGASAYWGSRSLLSPCFFPSLRGERRNVRVRSDRRPFAAEPSLQPVRVPEIAAPLARACANETVPVAKRERDLVAEGGWELR
ncbi:MAG: hypothetical protein KC978_24885, partial [Candidatus Omnitrophica bacterium]|nr:hypothetical protein [Candidatus Omnitrophota bacterium]